MGAMVAGRGDVEEGVGVVAGAGDPGDAHFSFLYFFLVMRERRVGERCV